MCIYVNNEGYNRLAVDGRSQNLLKLVFLNKGIMYLFDSYGCKIVLSAIIIVNYDNDLFYAICQVSRVQTSLTQQKILKSNTS